MILPINKIVPSEIFGLPEYYTGPGFLCSCSHSIVDHTAAKHASYYTNYPWITFLSVVLLNQFFNLQMLQIPTDIHPQTKKCCILWPFGLYLCRWTIVLLWHLHAHKTKQCSSAALFHNAFYIAMWLYCYFLILLKIQLVQIRQWTKETFLNNSVSAFLRRITMAAP